ncbi:zinc-binding dehydrogenase [Mangrovicoccus ximenensis]|uniref:zinc-binding dehydrogenase n=1 Tax=Mangrovicoccus ximenensis TaxID=1911570 RepID=UPI000D3425C9|nr:zinc-binding dehydrogenase [Mangrovicoccus ximenensis]
MVDSQNEALRGAEEAPPLVSYAVLDRMLWARFQQAETVESYLECWLGLVTRQVDGMSSGLLVAGEGPDAGPFAPAARWPAGGAAAQDLARRLNTAKDPEALAGDSRGKGSFDVLFECSGAAPALAAGIGALAPRGVIVQLGMSGEMALPILPVIAKELELRGSFRFHEEFAVAVAMMRDGRIDPGFLLTHTLPLEAHAEAFETASDKSRAMKVQLDFA